MLIRRVIDYQIHDELYAALMHPGDQFFKVVKRSVFGQNIAIVADIVTVVVQRRFVNGREPNGVNAKVF